MRSKLSRKRNGGARVSAKWAIYDNPIIMIDEVRNQSFIMGWTSCHWPVTLVDIHGKKKSNSESL